MAHMPRRLPEPLRPGSRVGIMAPAGPVRSSRARSGLQVLEEWGFEAVCAPNVDRSLGYLAGDDRERLGGILDLLDQGVEALLSLRGGYGTSRILPAMPWETLGRWGGWVVGFSDVTALHGALACHGFPVATLHGPMVTQLGRDRRTADRLYAWLTGKGRETLFKFSEARVIRHGVARGEAVGGNLSVLSSLVGTPFEPPWQHAVVFLEEVGEPLYRLDRMLTQLRLASRLARVNAVVVGTLAGCGRGEKEWRRRWRELLADAAPGAVIVEGLAFGHGMRNAAFPLGVEVEVDTRRGSVRWSAGSVGR